MNQPLVSVIIPVYNAEGFLRKCVSSVLEQTYSNLEVILIEDGSTDRSAELCKNLQQEDERIAVVYKVNAGASFARADGLARAKGDYVLFLDSDDWIECDTIQACLSAALENAVDCVLFSYVKEYPGKSIEVHLFDHAFFYDKADAKQRIHRRLIGLKDEELTHPERIDNLASMCMKFYKKQTAQSGRFFSDKEVGSSEDTLFNLYALDDCSIGYLDQCFYHYRKDNGNSITTRYNPHLAEQWDHLYDYFKKFLLEKGHYSELWPLLRNRVACGMVGIGLNEIRSSQSIWNQSRALKTVLRKDLYEEAFQKIDISHCPIKWKVFFALCKIKSTFLLVLLLRIMDGLRSKVSA